MLVTMLTIKKILGLHNHISKLHLQIYMTIFKNKLLNIQQENLRPQRNIEINDKLTDERYQKFLLMTKNLMKKIR